MQNIVGKWFFKWPGEEIRETITDSPRDWAEYMVDNGIEMLKIYRIGEAYKDVTNRYIKNKKSLIYDKKKEGEMIDGRTYT